MIESKAIFLVITATFISSFGVLFLKIGSEKMKKNIFRIFTNNNLILGLSLYLISTIFFIWALNFGEVSTIYPLVSTGYIWTAILSVLFLKEKMNKNKLIGTLIILIGVLLISI